MRRWSWLFLWLWITPALAQCPPGYTYCSQPQPGSDVPITITPSTPGDPTIGLLPSARDGWSSWSTAGLQTIGGIPNRTTISTTLSPLGSGQDDTTQIQTALTNCPANQVVKLNPGVFLINGQGIYFFSSNCTLRGSGPGQQLNTGLNKVGGGGLAGSCGSFTTMTFGDASFCVDPTATQLVKADRGTNASYPVLSVRQPFGQDGYGASYNLAADVAQGTNTLTLATTPSPAIQIGDVVQVDEVTDSVSDVVYGTDFCAGPPAPCPNPPYSWPFYRPNDRSLSQMMEVTAISNAGKTITFATNFHYTFQTAFSAQLTQFLFPLSSKVGIEDLFAWGGMGGDFHGNIALLGCNYCWVKNVEATWSVGTNVGFYTTYRSVLRDSFIHESDDPNPGGGGYQTGLNGAASDNLFENNIMWSGNKEIVSRASGGGNVIAYNYMDDAFGSGYPDQVEAGVNTGHFTTPHLELVEGNYSQNYKGDSFWGNSITITVFRNWLSALRAAHPPLATYQNGGACYGDYFNRRAVDIQAYSFYTSVVANVLGMNGQSLITSFPASCTNETAQTGFLEQTYANFSSQNNPVEMWHIGEYQQNGNYIAQHTWVATTIQTQIRTANWDWVTQVEKCFDKTPWTTTGNTTDQGCSGVPTIPSSFYLTSKPAFFGTHPWPWVDPTTGATSGGTGSTQRLLPAMFCFQQNKMPGCALP